MGYIELLVPMKKRRQKQFEKEVQELEKGNEFFEVEITGAVQVLRKIEVPQILFGHFWGYKTLKKGRYLRISGDKNCIRQLRIRKFFEVTLIGGDERSLSS